MPVPADRPFPESVIDALLPRTHVDAVLNFAQTHGLWQHCCVFFPRFRQEVDDFWEATRTDVAWLRIEPTWVALLYAVLGIAVHQMDTEDAIQCGFADGMLRVEHG